MTIQQPDVTLWPPSYKCRFSFFEVCIRTTADGILRHKLSTSNTVSIRTYNWPGGTILNVSSWIWHSLPVQIGEGIIYFNKAFVLTGFRILIKSCILSIKLLSSQTWLHYILRNQTIVDVEDKWVETLDVLDDVDWNRISNAINFKYTIIETQLHSVSHFSMVPTNFFIKLVELILPIVIL